MQKLLRNLVVAVAAGTTLLVPATAMAQPSPAASADGAAVHVATAAVQSAIRAGEVRVVTKAGDGRIRISTFTPAPGVSAEQVARRLRAQGKPAKVVSLTADAARAAGTWSAGKQTTPKREPCWALGAARSIDHRCFVRWRKGGFPYPQIVILDQASPQYPVGRAAAEWNRSPVLNIRHGLTCRGISPGVHCIPIASPDLGADGIGGTTELDFYYSKKFKRHYLTNVQVVINSHYDYFREGKRRSLVCHELGHALGLDHAATASGCMTDGEHYPMLPSSDDFALLQRIYG